MVKLGLHIVSQSDASIGEISNDLIEAFKPYFTVTVEGKQAPATMDILLCHYLNPLIVNTDTFSLFKKKYLILPIDGTVLTKVAIDLINKFDGVITPATAGYKILKGSGVKIPIIIIPNYYKEDIFNATTSSNIHDMVKDKVVLYHESTGLSRKGLKEMYDAYIKTFSDTNLVDKVVLLVKDAEHKYPDHFEKESWKLEAIKLQKRFKKPAQIIKISETLDKDDLRSLWHRADIYVTFAKIEGFGIPMLRMAVLDKPIVCLDNKFSGYHDFLTYKNAYFIKCSQVESPNTWLYSKDSKWGNPMLDSSCDRLKLSVYNHLKGIKHFGLEEKERFQFDTVLKQYLEVLYKK